jgi:uncharacterized integral membrane protein
MIKKSYKYLLVAAINLIVLTVLLAFWTDDFELAFNTWVRPLEFLRILGFTLLSLIGMRLLIYYFRYKRIERLASKLKLAAVFTFFISSYLYVGYSMKFINNALLNRQIRSKISYKTKPVKGPEKGMKADSLTNREYQVVATVTGFPTLPNEATNISYIYEYDGFLPDYSFTLTYYLPKKMKVDIIDYKNGDFSKYQTFEFSDDHKLVTYNEYKQ